MRCFVPCACHKAWPTASTQQTSAVEGKQKLLQLGIHVLLYMWPLTDGPGKNGLAKVWVADSRGLREGGWRWLYT